MVSKRLKEKCRIRLVHKILTSTIEKIGEGEPDESRIKILLSVSRSNYNYSLLLLKSVNLQIEGKQLEITTTSKESQFIKKKRCIRKLQQKFKFFH